MTLDMPQKATEYIERRGSRFQREVSAIVLAFVTTQMQCEGQLTSSDEQDSSLRTGLDLFQALREDGPLLDDGEMRVFDRVKDYGRKVELS